MRPISIIDAPSGLGLRQPGVQGLPEALRAAGLLAGRAGVRHEGAVPVPPAVAERDPTTSVLNQDGILSFSIRLADRVTAVLDAGRFPLVLGGDCSILLGSALALRRRGRYGLFFIDGHADFYSIEAEPNGEVASMELAIATGREPSTLADLEGQRPLVREEDAVVFGFRDAVSAAEHGSPDPRESRMYLFDLESVRRLGAGTAAERGLAALEAGSLDGFFVHLDADVLDDEVMPAVDYRMPGGLRPEELVESLEVILASSLLTAMEVTIYNPSLDDEARSSARVLADTLNAAFARFGRKGPS